jgi:transcriptional regulator with XRE-family HTH domain
MSPEHLGKVLRARRKEAKITQRDLAALSGLAVHTLSDLESGKGNPTLEVLSRVSAVLGLEIRLAPRGVGGGGARSAVAGCNRPTG